MGRRSFRSRLGLLGIAGATLASCGGGGGSATGQIYAASAGGDSTALPYETVVLSGAVTGGSPLWRQVSGPSAEILGASDAPELRFVAPGDPGDVVFELLVLEGNTVRAHDEVLVAVESPRPDVVTALRGRIVVNGGGVGRAERVAHDPATQRAFVIDGVAGAVHAFDVSDPAHPVAAGVLPAPMPRPGFAPGPPVDVVAASGVLAVVHTGAVRQVPGRTVFYDPLTSSELTSWSTGAGPIDAEITPDGSQIAVACAGDLDASGLADPLGAVTWVRVPAGGPLSIDPNVHVRTFTFAAYEEARPSLLASGVRLPREHVGVLRDLEPRAVTFTPDGASIWLSLAANNALARIDLATGLVRDVRGLPLADWTEGAPEVSSLDGLRHVDYRAGRPSAVTVGGQVVPTLDFEGVIGLTPGAHPDEVVVEIVTARGPVLPPQDVDGDAELERPYALGSTGPRLVRLAVSALTGEIDVLGETLLRGNGPPPLSARPNLRASAPGLANHDEEAVDLNGFTLPLDPFGVHVGDAVRVPGEIWLADQYRPSLVRFGFAGAWMSRYVPEGANATGTLVGTERFPAVYGRRVVGGGFEGLAASADGETLYAILGRPLDNPDTADDAVSRGSRIVRLLAVARATGAVVAEYVYVLEKSGNVVRDLASGVDGGFLVLEEDPLGPMSALFRVHAAGATDLASLGPLRAAVSAALEGTAPESLGSLAAPVVPLAKSLALDLGEAGVRASAVLGSDGGVEIPILLRSDLHGLAGAELDTSSGTFETPPVPAFPTAAVTLFGARGRRLDASDLDGGNVLAHAPVEGWRQALDLIAFDAGGSVLLAGADGGAPRVLTGTPGYDETARVEDLLLDTQAFPTALELQRPDRLGRLRVSRVDGDADGDLLFERLVAFGGRSVFLARTDGTLAWDSGDRLDRRVIARQPAHALRLDAAAPDGGITPTCLALAEAGAARYLVAGLGGSGSVAFLDLADPGLPRFAGFVPTPADAQPVDLAFVAAASSPNGRPLLLLVDRNAGAVDLIEILQ